jgi:hypothetical protein
MSTSSRWRVFFVGRPGRLGQPTSIALLKLGPPAELEEGDTIVLVVADGETGLAFAQSEEDQREHVSIN